MGLHLGSSEELKINFNGISMCLNIPFFTPISNSVKLTSVDNYILKDANGLYLVAKKGE